MKTILLLLTLTISVQFLSAQDTIASAQKMERTKFYVGASFGPSRAIGDFDDTDVNNSDSGFAEDGFKLDFFGGYFITEEISITGIFRFQWFDTDISSIVESYNAQNPGEDLTISSEQWRTFSLLFGMSYDFRISDKYSIFPRMGLGPMLVTNPDLSAILSRGEVVEELDRKSETELGLGYELGFGISRKIGKHFTFMPMYTFSGGFVSISDVETSNTEARDYRPKIQSFNLGVSLAYRF